MAVSSLSLRVNEVQLAPTKLQTKQHCREAQARRNWSCRCLTSPAAKSTMCQRCLTQPQCSVRCVWKGAGSDCPEKPLWQRAQDTLCSTTVPLGRHTLRAKGWASTYRAAPSSAKHKQHITASKEGLKQVCNHCRRLSSFPASLPYPKVIDEGWQTEFY